MFNIACIALGLILASSAFAQSPAPVSDACKKVRDLNEAKWQQYYDCLETLEGDTATSPDGSTTITKASATNCEAMKAAVSELVAGTTDAGGACADPGKGTFASWYFGGKIKTEAGYTSAGKGGAILRFVLNPLGGDGFAPQMSDPSKGRTMDLFVVDFALRYTASERAVVVDSVKISSKYEQYVLQNLALNVSDRFVWDSARGQYYNNLDGKVILNLLRTAFTNMYPDEYVNFGAGARFQIRNFYVLPNSLAGGPLTTDPYNVQIPVSLAAAYSFFQGKLKLGAFFEYAINPFRTRNYTVLGRFEARYNLKTSYMSHQEKANVLSYKIDVGAAYELDFQNELASNYGTPSSQLAANQLVQLGLGFLELVW